MSEVKRYSLAVMEAEPLFEDEEGCLVLFSAYEDLAEKYEEGLQREAELQSEVQRLTFERQPLEGAYSTVLKRNYTLHQRLVEAEKLLRDIVEIDPRGEFMGWVLDARIDNFLNTPDYLDKENTE